MLSSTLRTARTVAVNVEILRAFVRSRELIARDSQLHAEIEALERRIDEKLAARDRVLREIMSVIRMLMEPVETTKRKIGFVH